MIDEYRVSGVIRYTADAVTQGVTCVLGDIIEGAVKDDLLLQIPEAQMSCKVLVDKDFIVVTGAIPRDVYVDTDTLVRQVVHDAGYRNPEVDFNCLKVQVIDELCVNDSSDKTAKEFSTSGLMMGYASRETPKLIDLPACMADGLASRLTEVRESEVLPYLLPFGRARVYVIYELGEPVGVHRIAISVQHEKGIKRVQLEEDIWDQVILPVVPGNPLPDRSRILIEPLGQDIFGGPAAEVGISGSRSIFLNYGLGPWVWADAFSRNDSLADDHRWGAYACRWIAKNLVVAGLADRIEVQIRYASGISAPSSVSVDTFGSSYVPNDVIIDLIRGHFDLSPEALIRDLKLKTPIYRQAAAAGHFGSDALPWECTAKAAEITRDLKSMGWEVSSVGA